MSMAGSLLMEYIAVKTKSKEKLQDWAYGCYMDAIRRKAAALRILKILKGNSKNGLDAKTAARIANEAKHNSRKSRRAVRVIC